MRGRSRIGLFVVAASTIGIAAVVTPAGAASVPSAPAKPAAAPGNAQARVTWVAPANNGSAINEYIVTPFVGATAQAARVFHNTLVSEIITGLTNETVYTFKVQAHNAVGTGAKSLASNGVRVGAPAAPARPTSAPGNALARVTWLAPANAGAGINGYVVTPYVGAVAKPAHVFNTTALGQNITGLVNGTTYTFKVQAKNPRGIGLPSIASMAVKPTAQPALSLTMNATIGQPILVDAYGMTVYMFVPDGSGTTSHVTGALRTSWPYVTWGGALSVGSGLTLASATAHPQADNTRLIAYNGHLLYTFVGDFAPGDATGQALNQFYVLDASGNPIL